MTASFSCRPFYGLRTTRVERRIRAGSISKSVSLRVGFNLTEFHAFGIFLILVVH